MKRSEKGVLGIILAATLMIGATAVVSANGGTLVDPNSFASKGKIQVKENETDSDPAIVIDSADLVTLANATNALNTQFTDSLAAAVNNIGSVPKTDRVSSTASFSDLLTGIKNSQNIPTSQTYNGTLPGSSSTTTGNISAAKEENLSLGTAAWVDGQLIVGTGADNNSYYNRGYADGLQYASNASAVTPIYHNHISSCAATCTYTIVNQDNGNGSWSHFIYHNNCGKGTVRINDTNNASYWGTSGSHQYYICGKTTETVEKYEIIVN